MYVPWGKALIFLSPLGSLTFQDFLRFLFILKLSYSKLFHTTLNYANIEEIMRFHNLGHKTFETDFSVAGRPLPTIFGRKKDPRQNYT